MNRRDLLKFGSAATVGLASAAPLAAAARAVPRVTALVDGRFPASRAFAAAARTSGASVIDTGGDVPTLWHEADGSLALSGLRGLTTYSDMLVVAALAAKAQLGFALRLAHDVGPDAAVHRLVDGPAAALAVVNAAAHNWPAGLWSLMDQAGSPREAVQQPVRNRSAALWSWQVA